MSFFFLKYLLTSRLTLFRISTLVCLGSCIHCSLARFLRSKKSKHSSSNHGVFWFNSCRPRLSVAEVCIFSLMCSQVLFMFSSSFAFSKAANLFVISIWYCSLTSGSLSFLKLNLCLSNLCAACLPTANLSLTFAITREWSVSQSAPLKLRTSSILECHLLVQNHISKK